MAYPAKKAIPLDFVEVEPVAGILRAPPFEAAAIDWNQIFGKEA